MKISTVAALGIAAASFLFCPYLQAKQKDIAESPTEPARGGEETPQKIVA